MAALIAGLSSTPAGWVTAQTVTNLHSFTARSGGTYGTNSDGALPYAGLIVSGNTLYGTAYSGGSSDNGTVFAVNTDGSDFANLHSFTALSGSGRYANSDGVGPTTRLILSGNTLYGTANGGGSSGNGTVFAINTDGTDFTNLHSFTAASGSYPNTNSDGVWPNGHLILSGNTLYGTAYSGGSSGNGTVFAVNTDGSDFTNLHSFTAISGTTPGSGSSNSDGAVPDAGLILSGNTLYGTAQWGGSLGNGTVFAMNTDGTGFTNLHSFAYDSDGALPNSLILWGNTLYGTTFAGGSSGRGTVFAVSTNGTGFANLHSFMASATNSSGVYTNSDGAHPYAGLVLSANTLYGTAWYGGSLGFGTVFAVCTDGTGFTNLHSFTYLSDGAYPNGLTLSGNLLYGTATGGGSSGNGTVFKLLINRAPSSVANVAPVFAISSAETNRFILSPNNADATVVLDGSQSWDADNDPLQFSWSADGQPNALATGALSTNQFALGPHTVQLVVSDSHDTATAQISFEVITPAAAVGQLMLVVDEATLGHRNKQPLLATLSAAMSSFNCGDVTSALNQLSAFQNKVRAQLAPWNPALASEFTAAGQQIITVVSGR